MRRASAVGGFLLVSLTNVAPVPAQQRAVTLAEAIRLAAENDPQVVQAAGQVRSTGAGVRAGYGAYTPSFQSSANYGTNSSGGPPHTDPITGEVRSGSSTGLNFGASAQFDLFDGFRRESDLRSARAQSRAASAGLDYERGQSALRTTTAFVQALQAAELVRVAKESIRRAEEQFKIAVARLSTRAATVADSLQAAAQLGQAQLRLLSQESQLAANEASLARVIGLEVRVTAVEDSTLGRLVAIADTAALVQEALQRSPQAIRADAAVAAQRAELAARKSGYLPSLSLSANTSYNGSDRNSYQLFNTRSVSLGVSIPLFNGFQRELNIAQQRAALDTERARAADTRRGLVAQLTAQLAALHSGGERIRLTGQILETTRANLRVQLERYRLGSIDITQLSRAQDQLNQAESDAIAARFDYVKAKAEIEAVVGRGL